MKNENHKCTIDSQKTKRREHKHDRKGNHQTHKRKNKKKGTKKKYRLNWKTMFKLVINRYLSKITLSVNGVNVPIKRQSVRLGKTRAYNMLPIRDSL